MFVDKFIVVHKDRLVYLLFLIDGVIKQCGCEKTVKF